MKTVSISLQAKQQGYILLMTLVMMLMLTVLAVTQISGNSNQTRLAANATDSEISYEKAEGALTEATQKIIKGVYTPANFLSNANGLYIHDPSAAPLWKTVNWNSSAVVPAFNGGTGANAGYIIEQLPSAIKPGQSMKRPTRIYRVTTQASGANGNSAILLQSTVTIQQ